MLKVSLATTCACLSLLYTAPSNADVDLDALLEMPLESLSDTKVVSATRTSLSLADIPAAVHVITAKEIKRSGARSVADVLVLAPGLHVAKFSNYDWGIAARTTNEALSNTMLVMVDGRSVFNGMFSGVDWDLIPVSLDNIDRIEVVLGPVGTIWGGNAANAVINIITLDAEDAPRRRVSASAGNYDYREYHIRDGGEVSENFYLSGYAEFVQHMPWTSDEERVQPHQDFRVYTERFGLRGDYQNLDRTISFQLGGIRSREDYYWGSYQPHFLFPGEDREDIAGYNTEMLSEEYFAGIKFLQELSESTNWEQQFWLTYSNSDAPDRNAYFTRLDSETSYSDSDVFGGHLSLGFNYRLIDEHFRPYSDRETYVLPYVRVTDESDFINHSVAMYFNYIYPLTETTELMVGNRWQYFNLVHDTFAQPQIRLMQEIGEDQRVWAGWGRSVITPARQGRTTDFHQNAYASDVTFCKNGDVNDCLPNNYDYMQVIINTGNENMPVPEVETFELGYRLWEEQVVQFDLSLFYSEETDIPAWLLTGFERKFVAASSPGTAGTIIDVYRYDHIAPVSSETYGGEMSVKWQPNANFQANASYSFKRIKAECNGNTCAAAENALRGYENEPLHIANAQVMWDINPSLWVSNVFQYIASSEPDAILGDEERVSWPSMLTWDLIVGWTPAKNYPEFTLTVENLFNDQVNEFPQSYSSFDNGTQYWLEVDWQWP
ncbi:TonB-dependent receptor plug domain-containing protein [Enterovibrio paralichthyis]|uniref:TonB-dependent receptor plug domain-containing protein n=1 Tax=Enterovibrio paralichthyis TaxID=2853805 RepID=UPI001C497838|nr:TonB-dependent receptor plug domain-containing protein [Enterovibrio paralichthyis]MBV7296321.1 TonB-dependent receptor plug domain-containing protein [Enterovibrio paralichthyis]